MPRARLYRRISDDREGREVGVGRQDESGRELGHRLGAEIVGVYTDNDVSASTLSTSPRPEYDRLLADAEADPGSYIIAYSNSRLTRRPAEWEDLIKLHERAGVTVHTCASGSVDLSRADGRGVARTIAAWDAAEAERTSERVSDDVLRRAKAGLSHGGSRAFGWTRDNKPDPYERPILLDLAKRVLAGEALNALATELTAKGVPGASWRPPRVVRPWRAHVIRQMLLNPRIVGLRAMNGEIIGKAVWDAAITVDQWEQLKSVLTHASRHSGGSPARVNIGTGLFLCGECDRPVAARNMAGKFGPRRQYSCASCGLYRRVEPVNLYVEATVVEMLTHYQDEAPPGADPAAVAAVQQLRERIEQVKREFTDDDTMSPVDLRRFLRDLRARLQAEEAKLVPARRRAVLDGVTGAQAAAAWKGLTLARQRAIIGALVEVRVLRSPVGRRPFDPATVEINPR